MITSLPASLIEASAQYLENALYESIMLTENRIEFLKSKNPTIDTSHDQLAIFDKPHEIIDHIANVGDPTSKKTHTQWILSQYKKKNIRQEDMGRVRTALTTFEKYKGKLEKKDINQYGSIGEVESAVHPHIGTAASKAEERVETATKGRTLVHQSDDGTKVYRLEQNEHGRKASQDIYGGGHSAGGTHTSWCTAARSEDCLFDQYSKETPLHVIHTPSGNVYQAHPRSMQLMDATDEQVTHESPDAKHISQGLDHVPGGWKLKVQGNLPNITTHDVDMAFSSGDNHLAHNAAKSSAIISSYKSTLAAVNHAHSGVRSAIAKNPNLPKHYVDQLLNDKDNSVRAFAAENPMHNEHDLTAIYHKEESTHNRWARQAVISHPNVSQELLKHAISNDESSGVAEAAVNNPKASADTLRHAVNTWHGYTQHAAAHPNATPDLIDRGLDHQSMGAQHAAISNPNANAAHITKALHSEHPGVRTAAIQHPNATAEHISMGIADSNDSVVRAAIRHPNATPEHIGIVMNHESPTIKVAAVEHPNISKDQLQAAATHKDNYMRLAAARNPHFQSMVGGNSDITTSN